MSAQPPGGQSLFDLLEQRLREHYASTLPRNVGYPRAVANAILGGINLPFEAGRHVAGDVVGSMYAASSGQSDNPLDQRIAEAYRAGGPAASLAAARTDPRKEVSLTAGALTELLNPTNYAGSGVLPRLGRVGELADVALTTPFRPLEVALGQVGRRAVGPAIQRAREALYGPTESVAGNVPRSAGLLGPVPPPPLRTPPPLEPARAPSIIDLARGAPIRPAVPKAAPLPEGLAPTRTPSITGLARQRGRAAEAELARRVTPAQERAATDVESLAPEAPTPAGFAPQEAAQRATGASETAPVDLAPTTREAGLAALSGRDTNTLLSVAYDHPNAVANAQRKYADVGALRARAIERIQADRGRVARLAAADPDLAARVAALPDAEAAGEVRKATQLSAPGGDVAAGGGGGMMVVTPLAAARTLGPDVARGADKVLEALTGATGADVATYGPESLDYYRTVRQAEATKIGTEAQAREAGLPAYVRGSRGPGEFVSDFIRHVRDQVVVTLKNQVLDKQHTRFMVGEYAPEASDVGGTFARIAADKRADRAAPVADTVGTFLDGWMGTDASARYQQGLDLGEGLVGSLDEAGQALGTPRRELPAMQRRIFGVLTAALRTRGPVSAASIPVGALRGELAPLINEFFRTVNRFPQRIGREVLFYLNAKANTLLASGHLLDRMASAGVDVAPLTGHPFTPEDVAAVAGPEWAHAWRSALATTLGAAEAETKRVLGSFAEKTALEKIPGVGKVFWLMGWSQRMLPVYAQVAARHPGVALAVGGATLEQARHLREQGLPPWAAGGIDTPIGRVNLLSPMPFSGELAGEALSALGEGDPGEAKTPYQTAEGIAGGLGLPVNPIVGTAAYVAGLTPKRPGDFDRWAGPINTLPGPTTGLDYGHLVDRAREVVTGLEAGDLKAGKKAPASEADKEFARLVFERTGLPLSDPRNIGAVIDSLADDPNTLAATWRKEAEANVAGRQGKEGVVSAVSPLTVSRIDPLARQANIGRQNQPYSYEQISAAYDAGQKKVAQQMTKANAASKAPTQRVYEGASEAQRASAVKSWLYNLEHPTTVPLETNAYNLRRTGGGTDLSGLRRR